MIATAIVLAMLWFVGTILCEQLGQNAPKIMAALKGQSWAAQPGYGRPVTIQFSRPDRAAVPVQPSALRAAA